MKRVTVDLEDELYRKAKIYCAENDLKFSDLVRKLLSELPGKVEKRKSK